MKKSIIEKLAELISDKVGKELGGNIEDKEIVKYGAISILQTINCILGIVILGIVLNCLKEALIVSLASAILRKYSGGAHATSPFRCCVIGSIICGICGTCSKVLDCGNILYIIILSIISLTISFLIIVRYAPVDSLEKPITVSKERKQFKNKSIIVLLIYCIIIIFILINNKHIWIITAVSLGVLWQSFTLSKFGIKFIKILDLIIMRIQKEGEKDE